MTPEVGGPGFRAPRYRRRHGGGAQRGQLVLPTSDREPPEIDTDPRRFRGRINGDMLSALRQIFEIKIPSPFSPSVNLLQNSLRVFQSPVNYSCLLSELSSN